MSESIVKQAERALATHYGREWESLAWADQSRVIGVLSEMCRQRLGESADTRSAPDALLASVDGSLRSWLVAVSS